MLGGGNPRDFILSIKFVELNNIMNLPRVCCGREDLDNRFFLFLPCSCTFYTSCRQIKNADHL